MDWRTFWDEIALQKDVHGQVARTSEQPVNSTQLDRIAGYIAEVIDLAPEDDLLDVCCGNGALTGRLANDCASATGIDFSNRQIETARAADWANSRFITGDAYALDEVTEDPFDKIVCYFSFQYFDAEDKGFEVLRQMEQLLKPGGVIFLGDIPNRARKHIFFPSLYSRMRHELRRLFRREPMGKFWKTSTLDQFARRLDLDGRTLRQPDDLLYAHYRFDYLLWKPE